MTKQLLSFCFLFVLLTPAYAQTLRVRCNSIDNLHVVAIGVDKNGQYTSRTIYDFTHDNWRTISLFDEKYGYDSYNNSNMKHEGYDPTCRWKKLIVYNGSNTICDSLDLTKPTSKAHIGAELWAKVKQRYDRNYLITDVILNDD